MNKIIHKMKMQSISFYHAAFHSERYLGLVKFVPALIQAAMRFRGKLVDISCIQNFSSK